MLTQEEVALLKTSFAKIEPMGSEATVAFYDRLFDVAPETRKLFGTTIDVQAEKLWDSIVFVFKGLDDLNALVPKLEKLGAYHGQWDLGPAEYKLVEDVLVDVVAGAIGTDWTAPHADAWHKALSAVSDIMMSGAADAKNNVA